MGDMVVAVQVPGNGVTRQQCPQCGIWWEIRRTNQRYCSEVCKNRAYNASHPVVRQARLDFTPAARELGAALRGRETKAQRILDRLKQGPANSLELLRVGGIRYSARIHELRKQGHRIETEEHAEWAVYTLEGE